MVVFLCCRSSVGCCITEDEAQQALLSAISERCCYGKTAATEMDVYQIISSCALHVSTTFLLFIVYYAM